MGASYVNHEAKQQTAELQKLATRIVDLHATQYSSIRK